MAERENRRGWQGVGASLVAPIVVFLAVLLVRLGAIDLATGVDLLTLRIAQTIAWGALALAVISLVFARRDWPRRGRAAVAALAIAVVTVGAFVYVRMASPGAGPNDVTTNVEDPPPSGIASAGDPAPCPGLEAVPTQLALEQAAPALQAAGFRVSNARLFEARGSHEGFWFGRRHEAVVRIRPGRTDVRVTATDDRSDGGATCRLAVEVVRALQAAR